MGRDSLAARSEGRVISLNFFVRLTPPETEQLGETDAGVALGRSLAREAMLQMEASGQAAGFAVEVTTNILVY